MPKNLLGRGVSSNQVFVEKKRKEHKRKKGKEKRTTSNRKKWGRKREEIKEIERKKKINK